MSQNSINFLNFNYCKNMYFPNYLSIDTIVHFIYQGEIGIGHTFFVWTEQTPIQDFKF